MPVVAMESQCMKEIRTYLVDKSHFILFNHKTHCKSFPALSLLSRKFQSILNTNLPRNHHTLLDSVLSHPKRSVSFSFQNY